MGHEHVIPEFAARMRDLPPDAREFPIQGSGLETRSFCHIDDCVDGLMVLLDRGEDRNVYHLGNPGQEMRIKGLAQMVAECFGRRVRVAPGELPKGSPKRRLPDISKLRALGYEPKVSLADGLPGTVEWYAANPREAAA
jgi:nucleoside-diphosphate-sugar epimerase